MKLYDSGILNGANVPLNTAVSAPTTTATSGAGTYVMNPILLADASNGPSTEYRDGQVCTPKYTRLFYNVRFNGTDVIDSANPAYFRMLIVQYDEHFVAHLELSSILEYTSSANTVSLASPFLHDRRASWHILYD